MNPEELARLRAKASEAVRANDLTGLCADLLRASDSRGHLLSAAMDPAELRKFLVGTWKTPDAGSLGCTEEEEPRRTESGSRVPEGRKAELPKQTPTRPRSAQEVSTGAREEASFSGLAESGDVIVGAVMRDIPSERRRAATREFLQAIVAEYRDCEASWPPWLSATFAVFGGDGATE